MGFLDLILGNAGEVSSDELQSSLGEILGEGETIEAGYRVVRDMFVLTSKRLILIDKQGMTGSKIEYRSIPYRSIEAFSVETAGFFDRDAELKLHVRGFGLIQKQISTSIDIKALCRVLATHVC